MPDDLPDIYDIRQRSPRRWDVTYEPDEIPACTVRARPGEPDEDGKHRASIIASTMNATFDMATTDIRELLNAYEQVHGRRHHADWRDESEEGDGRTAADVYQDDVRALLDALGLGTHARPKSPHDVLRGQVLPAVRRLRRVLSGIADMTDPADSFTTPDLVGLIHDLHHEAVSALDEAEGSDDA